MSAKDAKIERLAGLDVFAGCSTKELEAIAAIADETEVAEGTVVVTQGEQLRYATVIESGTGTVTINTEQVGTVEAGEILGEISMFDPAPAAATVTASTSMRVLLIPFAAFENVVREHPDLAVALLRTMARRFRDFRG